MCLGEGIFFLIITCEQVKCQPSILMVQWGLGVWGSLDHSPVCNSKGFSGKPHASGLPIEGWGDAVVPRSSTSAPRSSHPWLLQHPASSLGYQLNPSLVGASLNQPQQICLGFWAVLGSFNIQLRGFCS